jgi:hypothetical protein
MGGLLLAGWPGPARALDLNGIKVTPSVAYQGEYDDNVFRTKNDKRTDYANHFIPAITVEATPGKHEITAGFKTDVIRYLSYSNLNTERYYANFSGIFRFNRLELRGKEDFTHTDDFPSSELTKRIKRNENYLTGGIDYDVYRQWGIGFDTTWGDIYYLDHDYDPLSRDEYTYATNVYYRLTAKTRVFAEYNYVQEFYKFDRTRNDYRHRGLLGVRGDLTERLSLSARGGYEHLNFSDPSRKDQDVFAVWLEGYYKPLERLQINFLLSRDPTVSSFENNATYEPFNMTLGIAYTFTPKILIIPHGNFEVDTYRNNALNPDNSTMEKRLDYLYGGGLSIRYELQKWIKLDANYEYQTRQSNFSDFNYNDNRVWFTVTLSI